MTGLRPLYLLAGWIMLGLAAAGTVLPLLPTTPFLLAAVSLFCHSSPAMAARLKNHRVLGPPIRDWQAHRAISASAKRAAIASMGLGYGLTLVLTRLDPVPAGVLAALLVSVAAFILTRPVPSQASTSIG